jgi:hypothetical protein
MERFQVFLSTLQLKQLRKLSKATGISVAEHIRRAIDEYLKGQK